MVNMLDNNQQKEKQQQLLKSVHEEAVEKDGEGWKVLPSSTAKNCKNYIRGIVDDLHLDPNPDKKVIALSIGKNSVKFQRPLIVSCISFISKSSKLP